MICKTEQRRNKSEFIKKQEKNRKQLSFIVYQRYIVQSYKLIVEKLADLFRNSGSLHGKT